MEYLLLFSTAEVASDETQAAETWVSLIVWAVLGVAFVLLIVWALVAKGRREEAEHRENKDSYKNFDN